MVAFICNHCPYVKHIRSTFAVRAREWQTRGVAVVAINSNDAAAYPDDSPEAMAQEIAEHGYTFPYLIDDTQEVAKAYGAACTPDLFLFDGDRRLVYHGQFDGTRPGSGTPATGDDLAAAVDAVLAHPDAGRPAPERRLQHQVEARQRAGLIRTRSFTQDRPGVAAEHGDAASADDGGHPRVDGHTG